jgi:CTP synthase
MGGTMRLGAYDCSLDEDSTAFKAYGTKNISERHRHRLEFNNDFKDEIVKNGLQMTGCNEERGLAEIFESKSHRWFLGCQFHPEFKSKPSKPHPLFASFIKAAYAYKKDKENGKLG